MEPIEWALLKSLARLGLYSLPDVVAWLTEMVSTEAKPFGSLAAIATFIHYVLSAMFLTMSLARTLSY